MRRLLLIALLCACSKGKATPDATRAVPDAAPEPQVVRIEEVEVQLAGWPEGTARPDEARLRERVAGELELSNLFVMPGGEVPPGKARRARVLLTYALLAEGEQARSAVTLSLKWRGGAFEDANLVEGVGCDGKLADAAELLECAVSRAVKGILAKENIRRGDVGAVLEALESGDPDVRALAVTAIGDHRIRAAVPKLMVMLESSDERARDAAVGGLAALREKSAVKKLIAMAQFRDLPLMARLIDAIAAIGGDEARAWLELVASGHENPTIKKMAADALRPRPSIRPSPP